jgi:hypothetical protein
MMCRFLSRLIRNTSPACITLPTYAMPVFFFDAEKLLHLMSNRKNFAGRFLLYRRELGTIRKTDTKRDWKSVETMTNFKITSTPCK